MNLLERIHSRLVYNRRVRTLSSSLAELVPKDATVLDVGCGDGLISHLIQQARPDVSVKGIEVLLRDQLHIPVTKFDGRNIPYDDESFDTIMFVDVLHHADDPMALLREATRVAGRHLLIKDHVLKGFFAAQTLRLMDWTSNARWGVSLPYKYWAQRQWLEAFENLRLGVDKWVTDVRLYPWWADWVFGRSLHFIARLHK